MANRYRREYPKYDWRGIAMLTEQLGQLFQPNQLELMDAKQKHDMNLLMAKKAADMETHAFDVLLRKYPNVSFKHWLSTIDGEDWRVRASDYDEARANGAGSDYTYMGDGGMVRTYEATEQFDQNEQIFLLQRLAHLHTGRIEDIVEIVETMAPEQQPQQAGPGMTPRGGPAPSGQY